MYFRIVAIFYPGVAFGMMSSSMFQGTTKGNYALIVTLIRTLVFGAPFAYIFALPLKMGLDGVWWGMVLGNVFGSILAFSWAMIFIRKLMKERGNPRETPIDAIKSK